MKELVAGVLLGLIGGWGIAAFMWAPMLDRWIDAYKYAHERFMYFSDGAIDRGLVDICERDGKLSVWFVEDCDPN